MKTGRVLAALAGAAALYLAGSYLHPVFLVTLVAAGFYLLFAVVSVLAGLQSLRISQDFDTDHPEKAGILEYRFSLTRESPLPTGPVSVLMTGTRGGVHMGLSDLSLRVRTGRRYTRVARIACPFRGIYVVGAARVEVEDPLRLFRLGLALQERTFYVYPRLLQVVAPERTAPSAARLVGGGSQGLHADPLLFRSLREYREGDAVARMDPKRSAALGRPLVREYDSSAESVVRILIDSRPGGLSGEELLAAEDACIETALALGRCLAEPGTRCTLESAGWGPYDLSGPGLEACRAATINLFFTSRVGPARLLTHRRGRSPADSVGRAYVIGHNEDLPALVDPEAGRIPGVTVILVREALSPGVLAWAQRLRNEGRPLVCIGRPEELSHA